MTRVAIPVGSGRPLSVAVLARYVAIFVLTAVAVLAISDVAVDRLSASGREPALGLGTVAAGGHIPAAITAAERERKRLAQERDAFERFGARVESITVPTVSADHGVSVSMRRVTGTGTELSEIREAYRTTVMETDHYESEYGEPLPENMRIELSEDIATAIVAEQQFSHPLKQTLIQQSTVARIRRESLLQMINDERASLQRAQSRVQEMESVLRIDRKLSSFSIPELYDYDSRLHRCADRSEQLLRDRQQHLHSDGRIQLGSEQAFIQTYLYDSLEVNFPVLAPVTDQYERLRDRRRAVIREITSRYRSDRR